MKALLITFAVLLLLLTLLSTFGGSIRPGEPFYQPPLETPMMPEEDPSATKEYMYEQPQMTGEPVSMDASSDMLPAVSEQFQEYAPISENFVQQGPVPTQQPMPKASFTNTADLPAISEGFAIEPFEDEDQQIYASY
jgi:hypothetical protein